MARTVANPFATVRCLADTSRVLGSLRSRRSIVGHVVGLVAPPGRGPARYQRSLPGDSGPLGSVSSFCRPAIRMLVSRARSVSSLIWPSFTPIWSAQKFILAFEALDVAAVGGANGRVRSRLFGAVRCRSRLFAARFAVVFQGANGRVRSRLVATSRDCSHLFDVGDVALHGVRRDEVLFAGLGLDLVAIELGKSAVFLDCA